MSPFLRLAVLAALIPTIAVPAAPARSDPPPPVIVSYADLDLSTPAGRAMLKRRVQLATGALCQGATLRAAGFRPS
ncbi:UrcA family protein [Sphingomonas jatrophae]|uniref:UrcA family protein n=1 Tax=Sphingomonas jatrophae TaxID=1166337 RepID=A0A1I6L1Y1_9SPHN|nr:UrcA family protein [Sphingomonas jatrophae]SFR97479.1 UrcA family protein [Sphingomonas jatrophae]